MIPIKRIKESIEPHRADKSGGVNNRRLTYEIQDADDALCLKQNIPKGVELCVE